MALERLFDCYNTTIGAVQIARGSTFSREVSDAIMGSPSDAAIGDEARDRGVRSISATLEGRDPLGVPLVLALTFPAAVSATGHLRGAPTTYRKLGLANAVMTEASLRIADKEPGTCRFAFRNRCLTQVMGTEAPAATGSAPTLVARANTLQILPTSTFTEAGGAPVTLLGLSEVTWQARAGQVSAEAAPGTLMEDCVDAMGWEVSGSMTMSDKILAGAVTPVMALAGLKRGTLVVNCRVAGYADAAAAPADKVVTFSEVQFHSPKEGLASKDKATGSIEFTARLYDGEVALVLADLISVADAA